MRLLGFCLHPHSPDHQQNGSVQAPLQGAQSDALDPDQLVGFVLAQAERGAARHGASLLSVFGFGEGGTSDSPARLLFLSEGSHVQPPPRPAPPQLLRV